MVTTEGKWFNKMDGEQAFPSLVVTMAMDTTAKNLSRESRLSNEWLVAVTMVTLRARKLRLIAAVKVRAGPSLQVILEA
jgi:hypothetical protein